MPVLFLVAASHATGKAHEAYDGWDRPRDGASRSGLGGQEQSQQSGRARIWFALCDRPNRSISHDESIEEVKCAGSHARCQDNGGAAHPQRRLLPPVHERGNHPPDFYFAPIKQARHRTRLIRQQSRSEHKKQHRGTRYDCEHDSNRDQNDRTANLHDGQVPLSFFPRTTISLITIFEPPAGSAMSEFTPLPLKIAQHHAERLRSALSRQVE